MRLLPRRTPAQMLAPARDFLGAAHRESRLLGHDYVGSEHVLLALAEPGDGRAAKALRRLGVTAADVRADILGLVGLPPGPRPRFDRDALASLGIDLDEVRRRVEDTFGAGALERGGSLCTPVCPRAKLALQRASENAAGPLVTDEDVLVGLLSVEDSVAARVLRLRGVTVERVRSVLAEV